MCMPLSKMGVGESQSGAARLRWRSQACHSRIPHGHRRSSLGYFDPAALATELRKLSFNELEDLGLADFSLCCLGAPNGEKAA